MFVGIGKSCIFASLFERRVLLKEVWRGGRVVDYSGLENRRTVCLCSFCHISAYSILEKTKRLGQISCLNRSLAQGRYNEAGAQVY